ncbi:hypothetical protein RRG08_044388 [Elysia crispata]|uniref:Uncharacterized protein n=1 Tax=Elysia crispata TaxID=231223 RepID=A0AAE0ZUR7_9GAST|nr:hypothetical protein RRG08_044388 [Elysia crispata]
MPASPPPTPRLSQGVTNNTDQALNSPAEDVRLYLAKKVRVDINTDSLTPQSPMPNDDDDEEEEEEEEEEDDVDDDNDDDEEEDDDDDNDDDDDEEEEEREEEEEDDGNVSHLRITLLLATFISQDQWCQASNVLIGPPMPCSALNGLNVLLPVKRTLFRRTMGKGNWGRTLTDKGPRF